MKPLCRRARLLLLLVCCLWQLEAAAFDLGSTQINVALVPGVNQVPLRVPISVNSADELASLTVHSDSTWVSGQVDKEASVLVLTFKTAALLKSSYAANITLTGGGRTDQLTIQATLAPLNIIALRDDQTRSRVYGLQQNGSGLGCVVIFDPIRQTYLGSLTVGSHPTDLAVSADGKELLVINSVDQAISVVDLQALALTDTLALPVYSDWEPGTTTAHLALGSGNIIYYTDGAGAPVLHVFDRQAHTVTQNITAAPDSDFGLGGIVLNSDKTALFGWAQYGWTAGSAYSFLCQFAVQANGTLTFITHTNSVYPNTGLSRDPLNTPIFMSADDQKILVKQLVVSGNSIGTTLRSLSGPVYALSPNAEIISTDAAIYEWSTGNRVYELPATSTVQVVTSDYSRLVLYDPVERTLTSINLPQALGDTVLGRDLSPVDQSITLAPAQLEWTALPGIGNYQIYLGESESAVAAAGNGAPEYLGQIVGSAYELGTPLTPGHTYFWRVDAVEANEVVPGEVHRFTVSTVASNLTALDVATVHGQANLGAAISLTAAADGTPWSANASVSWMSFIQSNGVTPATLGVHIDASQLAAGAYQANITLSTPSGPYVIPVHLQVDSLAVTMMRSDPASNLVYAISEDASQATDRAYLVELDSQQEAITRVVPVGRGVTDLAIHHGDNRVYVADYEIGALVAVDLDSFAVVRTYSFVPAQPMGYGGGDVYRISAGGPDRLLIEEEDQWIDLSVFDTSTGTVVGTTGARQGGGAYDPTGRYYYHGDDDISNASLHKYDTVADQFYAMGSVQVQPVYYFGSRTVVMSDDGSRIFWNGGVFDANLNVLWNTSDEVYSASADGRFAFSETKIYDTVTKAVVAPMPVATEVSAFNSNSGKLVAAAGADIRYFSLGPQADLATPVLAAGRIGATTAILNWSESSSALRLGFTLQVRLSDADDWSNTTNRVGFLPNAFMVSGLTENTTYSFRVMANTPWTTSDWSNVVTVTTLPAFLDPPPPIDPPPVVLPDPPTILLPRTDLTKKAGQSAVLSVTAHGANLTFQWQKNGVNLANGGNLSGVDTASLRMANLSASDMGAYRLVVSGDGGNITSQAIKLVVQSPPTITSQPRDVAVKRGATVRFAAGANGDGPLQFTWFHNNTKLHDSVLQKGTTTRQLMIKSASIVNGGRYRVVITNAFGKATSNDAKLTVK